MHSSLYPYPYALCWQDRTKALRKGGGLGFPGRLEQQEANQQRESQGDAQGDQQANLAAGEAAFQLGPGPAHDLLRGGGTAAAPECTGVHVAAVYNLIENVLGELVEPAQPPVGHQAAAADDAAPGS